MCGENPNVVAVVLFGSLARGTATPGSDADLLVVLRADERRMLDRIPEFTKPFESPGLSVQALPWTEAELQHRRERDDPFAREVLETGVVLAGATP